MSPYHKKQKEKRRKNLFRKWHRRLGFMAALFLINLAVTGILLNHSEALNLHKQFVKTDWLVNWYGITPPNHTICFNIAKTDKPLCQLGEKRILGGQILEQNATGLIGISEFQELFYIASPDKISLYTKDWSLVEILEQKNGLPVPISAIGLISLEEPPLKAGSENFSNYNATTDSLPKTLSLVVSSGQEHYLFDPNELTWNPIQVNLTTLIQAIPTSNYSLSSLQSVYLDNQISYLKLVQDLHSGRIINSYGKWITDIVGIIMILLALSGFLAWQRRTKS